MTRRQGRRSPYWAATDHPVKRVKFIPVQDGTLVELGATSVPGASPGPSGIAADIPPRWPHTFIGFKPGPGPRATGWLVVLVDERHPGSQPVRKRA